jgi:prepilin-type N-terminal cleavage/methylation domain-containing protein
MKKGFTLIELVVAVALLSMVLSFAGVIFNVSIESHRTAKANAEIMRKLRAITDQLNTDFAGIQTDAPLLVSFMQDPNDPNQRYDQIMFFANGDFQSIQLYEYDSGVPDPNGDRTISGNVARIHYGQAQVIYPDSSREYYPDELEDQDRILARRPHILTTESWLEKWPEPNMRDFDIYENEVYEHDALFLLRWKRAEADKYDDKIVLHSVDYRPLIDMTDQETFQETYHKLMCEGVGSFAIQWAYWDDTEERFFWFPSDDPDGDGSDSDSHFGFMPDEFGVYFNVPNSSQFSSDVGDWYPIGDENVEYRSDEEFSPNFYPKALKFTFRLYDSKGLIEQDGEKGREFTHIVYLGG